MSSNTLGMTSFSIQLVIDCAAPHVLADWWAETLGWEVEPQDEAFIRSMIDKGFATEAETTLHDGSLVWKTATALRPPPPAGPGQPRMLFQQVPEAKTVKNRMHLDLRTPDGEIDLAAFRASLVERGATEIGGGQQGPHRWITLADPEGNEFCVDL